MRFYGFAHFVIILLVPVVLVIALVVYVVFEGGFAQIPSMGGNQSGQIIPIKSPSTTTDDKKVYTDSDLGFKVETPTTWQSLKGPCEEIIVAFTSSDQALYDYVSTQGWGSKEDLEAVVEQISKNPSLSSQILFNLDNFKKEDYLILGPQSEGEINSLFVKSDNGYFDITVWATDQRSALSSSCVGDAEYKDVLRSFSLIK